MDKLAYDSSRKSLYLPGNADDFFQLGSITSDAALCAEMARLAYVKEESRLKEYLQRANFELSFSSGYGFGGTQMFIATQISTQLTVISLEEPR